MSALTTIPLVALFAGHNHLWHTDRSAARHIVASSAMAGALTRCGGQRLPGRESDSRARYAQTDHGWSVTRDDYRTEDKAAGIRSLFSCRIGRTPVWGGHAPPA